MRLKPNRDWAPNKSTFILYSALFPLFDSRYYVSFGTYSELRVRVFQLITLILLGLYLWMTYCVGRAHPAKIPMWAWIGGSIWWIVSFFQENAFAKGMIFAPFSEFSVDSNTSLAFELVIWIGPLLIGQYLSRKKSTKIPPENLSGGISQP